jgi:hypothetical protein
VLTGRTQTKLRQLHSITLSPYNLKKPNVYSTSSVRRPVTCPSSMALPILKHVTRSLLATKSARRVEQRSHKKISAPTWIWWHSISIVRHTLCRQTPSISENEGQDMLEPPHNTARFGISDLSSSCKVAIGCPWENSPNLFMFSA